MSASQSSPDPADRASLHDRMLEAVTQIEASLNRPGQGPQRPCFPRWVSWLADDDDGGKLTVLACPQGDARSALATGIVSEFLKATRRVPSLAWFSLEASGVDAALRLLGLSAGLPPEKVAEGWASHRELILVIEAANRLASHTVLLDDAALMSVTELRARCVQWRELHGGCGPVLIDGVESLQDPEGWRWGTKPGATESIADSLRHLARDLATPVVVLATQPPKPGESEKEELLGHLMDRADQRAWMKVGDPDPRTGVAPATLRVKVSDVECQESRIRLLFRCDLTRFEPQGNWEDEGFEAGG